MTFLAVSLNDGNCSVRPVRQAPENASYASQSSAEAGKQDVVWEGPGSNPHPTLMLTAWPWASCCDLAYCTSEG